MRTGMDKYMMVAGEFLASGAQLKLPVTEPWPELLTWEEDTWVRSAAEGFNVFKLMMVSEERGYRSPFWLTLRDGEEAGGKLRPGAVGVNVADWQWTQKNEKFKGDIDPKNVKPKKAVEAAEDQNGEEAVAMRPRVVFNADQWEELVAPRYAPRQIPTREEALERAEQLERLGAGCEIKHGGTLAYYNPSLNYISLPPKHEYKSPREYYWALFEQMGHALASKHQMNLWGGQVDPEMANDVSFKALYAKMTAAMLAYEAGVDVLD